MLFGHMLVFMRDSAVRCEANVNIIEVEQKKNRTHTRGDMFTPEEKTFKSIMCEKKKKKDRKSSNEKLSVSSESHVRSHAGHFCSG